MNKPDRTRTWLAAAMAAGLLAGAISGPAQAQTQAAKTDNRSEIDKTLVGAGKAASRPLRDLNIIKVQIPPGLVAIMDRPYAMGRTCPLLRREVQRMTAILGPDVDSGRPRKGMTASEKIIDGAEGVSGGIIPGQGLLRKLTGAQAGQKRLAAAILAGHMRRAYAKGMARGKGCRRV
ncbi:hypothetical protein [Sandarakinorhabdus sp.]|uniref:hypothetical protein n=1 Tax=Sandarakinorhabdus sp. TaxID=1916663 RepID=UPI00286D9D8B|nr:hypothetical protein [Sandarakinorhabdus sp.]